MIKFIPIVLEEEVVLDGNATESNVLNGKTFYSNSLVKKTGTMVNRGTVSTNITTKAQQVTIAQGYHSGSGIVQISSTEQAKIIADNIKSGVTILGVAGTVEEGVDEQTIYGQINVQSFGSLPTVTLSTDGATVIDALDYSIDNGTIWVELSSLQTSYTIANCSQIKFRINYSGLPEPDVNINIGTTNGGYDIGYLSASSQGATTTNYIVSQSMTIYISTEVSL